MPTSTIVTQNLGPIAEAIQREHDAALGAARSALDHARRAGELLLDAKAQLPHGQWLPWLREHCPSLSEQQAQRYMRVARRWPELEAKSVTVTDLTQREALALLAAPDVTEPADLIAEFRMAAEAWRASMAAERSAIRDELQRIDAAVSATNVGALSTTGAARLVHEARALEARILRYDAEVKDAESRANLLLLQANERIRELQVPGRG